jgi:hypothetical protein
MDWEVFDIQKNQLSPKIVEFIECKFDRNQPFSAYTLVDKFYDAFITYNFDIIVKEYESYRSGNMTIKNVLYLSLVAYAIETTHYFYVLQFELFYKYVYIF